MMLAFLLAAAASLAPSGADPATGEVLYSRLTDDVWQVWRRDLATGRDEQVTFSAGDKRYPRWTPAGEIYYHTINQGCFLVRTGADGEQEHVALLEDVWPVRDVAWSPGGERLAFSRIRTDVIDAANLCVAPRDGAPRWLTQDPGIQYNPTWSPDGTRLAFVSGNGWGTYEIETIALDGGDRRKLTDNGGHEFLPSWSPDGRSIAFVSDRGGSYDVWTMAPDGSGLRRLTEHAGLDTGPCWSPDGGTVAYTSARGGRVQIWATPAGGGEARPLIDVPGGARDPAWRARPASTDPADALALGEVGAFPKRLSREDGASVEVRFKLSHPARVRADLVDEDGRLWRTLGGERHEAGPVVLTWDGTSSAGEPVPGGVYRYVLIAEDDVGRRAVHDPSTEPWGEEMQPTEFTFDEQSGRLRWIQPRAGFARLRAAVHGFPMLDTLMDWEPLEGGEQIFDWNGLDPSGAIELGTHPRRWITLEMFSMPRNTILVDDAAYSDRALPTASYPPMVAAGDHAHLEARKPRRDALAPALSVDFPSSVARDPEGRPIVSGQVPVRVSIASQHAASMTDALFEVAFYVDLTFFFEDEESTTPMTWMWDTRSLPPGPHLLTVNVFSYDGRIGCLTRPVVIESAQ